MKKRIYPKEVVVLALDGRGQSPHQKVHAHRCGQVRKCTHKDVSMLETAHTLGSTHTHTGVERLGSTYTQVWAGWEVDRCEEVGKCTHIGVSRLKSAYTQV